MASGEGNGKKPPDMYFSKRPNTKPPRYYGSEGSKIVKKATGRSAANKSEQVNSSAGKSSASKSSASRSSEGISPASKSLQGISPTSKSPQGRSPTSKNVGRAPQPPSRNDGKNSQHNSPARESWLSQHPTVPIIAGGVVFVIVIVAAILFFTNKNAYEVYVSGNLEGVIAKSKDVTEDYIYTTAVAKLQREVGSNVSVNEEVTFVPVHAGKKEFATTDYIIGNIYKKWHYQVEATILSLNGVEMATLSSDKEVDTVLERLASNYIDTAATLVGKPECEGITTSKKFVEPADIITADAAYAMLNNTTEKTRSYQVQSGDSLGKIASNAGMSLDELLAVNPGLNVNSRINIGQSVTLVSQEPIVSVTTVEEVVRKEVIPKGTEKRENAAQHTSYSKIIQQGSDGEREITDHITRVNGTIVKTEQISEKTVTEPVNEVVEVGANSVITAR